VTKNTLLRILLLISLISLPACDREADIGYGPPDTQIAQTGTSAEPAHTFTNTQQPVTPTPTPWPFQPESLAIRLDKYLENQDGSLKFWVYVVNPNPGPVTDCVVSVMFYDSEGNQLIENQESCGRVEAYSEHWVVVDFDESFIPENYQAYKINAQATAPGSKLVQGELNDMPVIGPEGVEISKGRILPKVTVELDWFLPQNSYLPGNEIQAQMDARLVQGQLEESLLCLEVVESRDYGTNQTSPIILAESCQTVSWDSSGENQQSLSLSFLPSGYTWIQKEDPEGDYIPLEISARAEVLLRGVSLAEMEKDLYLPPVEVKVASWSADGLKVDTVQPETPYLVDLKLKSLAGDPLIHSVQLSIRYTEQDPEEWLFSGLLLFLPCLLGFCQDEAVIYTQQDQVTLDEGAEYVYSIPIQLPEEPTGESGISGYYYLTLAFDGVSIWQGGKVPLETGSDIQ